MTIVIGLLIVGGGAFIICSIIEVDRRKKK